MFVAYERCTFIPDPTSGMSRLRGDGELVVSASQLGLDPEIDPPKVITVERAPGVIVQFEGGGRVYYDRKFEGWSYWEEDETFEATSLAPYVNFKILAE